MNKLISVIVPVYNAEKYLDKCIESIVSQTYNNLEIILIDDGSNDNSGTICDSWKNKDSRIKVLHQKNCGVSKARNNALKICEGYYIGFVDSDDFIDKNMYEILYQNIEKFNADISMCNYTIINGKNHKTCSHNIKGNILEINDKNEFFYKMNNNYFQGFMCNKLFKKSLFKDILFDENIYVCEDLLIVTKIAVKSKKFVYDDRSYYNYVINNTSATVGANIEKKLTVINSYNKIIDILKCNNIDCIDEYIYSKFAWETTILRDFVVKNKHVKNNLTNLIKKDYDILIYSNNIDKSKKKQVFIRHNFYHLLRLLKKIKKVLHK